MKVLNVLAALIFVGWLVALFVGITPDVLVIGSSFAINITHFVGLALWTD